MSMGDLSSTDTDLSLRREIFAWCLRNAHRCLKSESPGGAAQWCLVAARLADRYGIGQLASGRLENLLLEVARTIPIPTANPVRIAEENAKKRWLHVLTESYPVGGHTALVKRWIEMDSEQSCHSVVLLDDKQPRSPALVEAAQKSGGSAVCLGNLTTIVEKAQRLREITYANSDVVVVHAHMWDVVPTIAYGVPSGPPVLLLNHADHTFWVGSAIADRILNLRESGARFSSLYRGVERNVELPIPLPDLLEPGNEPNCEAVQPDNSLRAELEIPAGATLMLTVGSEYKYRPVGSYDFLDAAKRIVGNTDAYLVAVGPRPTTPAWAEAREATGGRIIAVGVRQDLGPYHRATDLYLEGFPFGSLTALLEAALLGIPCVRAPGFIPPPFASDGAALADIPQPRDLDDFVQQATELVGDPARRKRLGESLARNVQAIHCRDGWLRHLAGLNARVPPSHSIHPFPDPARIPPTIEDFWSAFLKSMNPGVPLAYALHEASLKDLDTRFDARLWLGCRPKLFGVI